MRGQRDLPGSACMADKALVLRSMAQGVIKAGSALKGNAKNWRTTLVFI